MLIPWAMHPDIEAGVITMTVRHWKRPQARVGSRQRLNERGVIVVEAVDVLPFGRVTKRDAVACGFADREALRALHKGIDDDVVVHRIRFHFEPEAPPPRVSGELSAADVAALDRKLDGIDGRSPFPAWTAAVLALIAEHPGRRAGDLADMLGRERLSFKADVRKLKALGLTESLDVGYRLSPRGETYWRETTRRV